MPANTDENYGSCALTLWHNPRCSKSREALALLRARGVEPMIREYLKAPPNRDELCSLLAKLGLPAQALVRTGEAAYAQAGLASDSSEVALLDAMVAAPILIQRPILVRANRAVIGRPAEALLALLDD
jgi:arsenate reductase